jgi:D-ribose pyranose/furanose isomerase RbsD
MNKKPFISKELIDYLGKLFPDKLPIKRGISEVDIAFLQGQQSVINRMELLYEDDQPEEI